MIPTPATSNLPSFTDAAGRTWRLSVTIGAARTIKQTTGIDFTNIADGSFFLELRAKAETFGAVLWVLCEAQAKLANPPLSIEQFYDAIDGDALDGAREAITQAAVNFTPAARRGALRAALAKMAEAEAKAMNAIESWTRESGDELLGNVDAAVKEMLENHGRESPK